MKSNFNKDVQILSSLNSDVTLQNILERLKTSKNSPEIYKTAQTVLEKMQGKWKSAALFQWFNFELDQKKGFGRICQKSGEVVQINLGQSIKFLKPATHVILGVYSVGEGLDGESANTSLEGNLLEAYIIDLIGLAALEKICAVIKKKAEDQARKVGWGVSPFLSPGSVHGWDLEEQSKLCQLLPIDRINVSIKNNSVLFPLKSIVALIGIGSDYETAKVGSKCDVCSKRDNCQMKRDN